MLRTAIALLIVLAAASPVAAAQPPAPLKSECFLSRDWRGWKAAPDARSIYIRVDGNRIFRIDLSGACPMLRSPGVFLVTKSHGSSWICHPLDLDLSVSDGHGMKAPCLVKGIGRLTVQEAAALPKDLQP